MQKILLSKYESRNSLFEVNTYKLAATLRTWIRRHKTRRQLAQLDHRMLSDIGLSRADALKEANKAFWEK